MTSTKALQNTMMSENTPSTEAETVSLYISPTRHHYLVPKSRLISKSPYFAAMFSGPFIESSTSSASFPEDTVDVFHLFLCWIYHSVLPPITPSPCPFTNSFPSSAVLVTSALESRVKLYCFAEKICQQDLMDETISMLIFDYKRYDQDPLLGLAIYAFDNSEENSPIRRFMADPLAFIHRGYDYNSSTYSQWSRCSSNPPRATNATSRSPADLHAAMVSCPDLGIAVLIRLGKRRDRVRADPVDEVDFCTWHAHAQGAPCRYPNADALPGGAERKREREEKERERGERERREREREEEEWEERQREDDRKDRGKWLNTRCGEYCNHERYDNPQHWR